MLSIFIPSRNEIFLNKTIEDLLTKAVGEIEIIAVLDGYWPLPHKTEFWETPAIIEDKRVRYLHRGVPMGMRAAINAAASIAKGEYYMKCDAHCMFAPGFDEALQKDIEKDWVVIPRRKRLEPESWGFRHEGRPDIDLHYLACPITNRDNYSMHGCIWPERDRERLDVLIDDTMSFQGSSWTMHRDHFHKFLGGMSEVGYGTFCQEPQEIGNKTWLGGGRVVVNKKTWYAHLHKGKQYGRGYHQDKGQIIEGHVWAGKYWMSNSWEKRIHDIDWLVEKFWPVPTWPEDWKDYRMEWRGNGPQ